MKLQSEVTGFCIFDGSKFGVFGRGDGFETLGKLRNFVAMRIPYLQLLGQTGEQSAAGFFHRQSAFAVFAFLAALHFSVEELGHDLKSETDAKDWDAQFKNLFVGKWGLSGVNAGGAAGKNDSLWLHGSDLGGRRVVVEDNRIHLALTNAAGNDLSVLGSKI